ncbi:septum formation inhibitor Maf [Nocardioides sp. HDW12B]|nr:nucleoside triphosphate pyrophosphatase [Nocardioides sp. HDW12B]QIK68359.1 septum formation inhibitor Maf [Nocardioides sp. HDW12B]
MPTRLILASRSPARLATLRSAGLAPEVVVSGVDESQVALADAAALATELAVLKAQAVAGVVDAPGLVVGCDSVLELDGQVHGKSASADEATARWRAMRGRTGVLHTGHCVVDLDTGRQVVGAGATTVRFAEVTDAEITAYVATGEPLEVAGAFTLDGLGGAFVAGIEGDPHNVVGISLPLLRELLADLGHAWTDFWAPRPD